MTTTNVGEQANEERTVDVWLRLVGLCARIYDTYDLKQKYEKCEEVCRAHPFLTVTGVVTVFMCAVPVAVFSGFVLTSVVVTFLGFLFVEGTVLAAGAVILIVVLGVVAMLGVMFSVALILAWFGYGLALRAMDYAKTHFFDSSNMTLNGCNTNDNYYYDGKANGKEE